MVLKAAKREVELDFLRGIAILLVLDYHSSHPLLAGLFALIGYPHFGWIGVDIFFVLSGFLIGGLLMREWKEYGGIDTRRFLIRRAFKIWPQYYFFIGFMILTRHLTLSHSVGNLLHIQNYWFGVSHTWSLAVEEHVYALLLLIFFLASRWSIGIRSLAIFLMSVCLGTIALRYVLAASGKDIFFPTQTRLDGILYGILLAIVYHFAPAWFERLRALRPLWVVLIILALACLKTTERTTWVGALHQDAAHIFAISILLLIYRNSAEKDRHWTYNFVAWIGLYSYGIYLWHTVLIKTISEYAQTHLHMPGWAIGTVLIVQGVLLGYLTSRSIEFPALHLRDRLFPRRVPSAIDTPGVVELGAIEPSQLAA